MRVSRISVLAVSSVALLTLVGCSKSDSDGSADTTTTTVVTTTTAASTTTAATETTSASSTTTDSTTPSTAAPSTSAVPPITTPSGSLDQQYEDVAISYTTAALQGRDVSAFVRGDQAKSDAKDLEGLVGKEFRVYMDPDYVDPGAQGGEGGDCQLIGDVTAQCAVRVESPGFPVLLVGVAVTNSHPDAESPEDPRSVPPYVVGAQLLGG